ncbi:hypothetical protein ACUY1T_07915 [Billgrantia sp. Q4P2]|uniref:hypothetical protein n=1 Tax=Billgrantia sp. Q4P2 TaxID=3463857 RepID=UPI004057BA6A
MKSTRHARRLAFIAFPLLAACGNSTPQVSDEQLLHLLGESREAHGEQLPPSISRGLEECVRLLSGLEDEIVKDIPAEFLGQMKAECRVGLREYLENPDRNPMGLELAHFDERQLGERVSELAEPSRLAAQQAAAEARERHQQAQIEEAKETIANLLASLDERLTTFDELCTALNDAKNEAQSRDVALPNNLRWYAPPPCNGHYAQQVRTQAEQVEERLSTLQPSNGVFGMMLPPLGAADPERMDTFKAELEANVRQIRSLLQDS